MSPPPDLTAATARLDGAPAEDVIAWAHERFGGGLVLAASFTDCVLIDVAARVVPRLPVVFLDTQYHFPATLSFVEQVRARYDLDLRVVRPLVAPDDLWRTDAESCCRIRKVEPLARALRGRTAWMTGLRRAESPTRSAAAGIGWDASRGLVKVNPLIAWTDADVEAYSAARDLPRHPLAVRGYTSMGCWPCTRPTTEGEHARAGRWAGTPKTECGLHR